MYGAKCVLKDFYSSEMRAKVVFGAFSVGLNITTCIQIDLLKHDTGIVYEIHVQK